MRYLTRTGLIIVLTLVSIVLVDGQRTRPSPSQPKPPTSQKPNVVKEETQQSTSHRQVTVNLKTGAPVTGQFVQADPLSIQIEVAGNLLKIKIDDVVSVVFAPELVPKQAVEAVAPPKDEDANRALRALRKLAGATEIGISFQEYGSRLIDVKNEVDDASSRIPAGDLKNELSLAMEAYADAGQAWNQMIRYEFMLPNSEPGLTLIRKYSLQPTELVPGNRSTLALPRNYVLTSVWGAARSHIDRASSMLSSEQATGSTPKTSAAETTTTANGAETATTPTIIVGTWLVTLTVGSQSSQTRFVITSVGDRFTGQFISPQGTTPVNRIDVTGNTISASFQDVIDRQRVSIDFSAAIVGDKMSGTARVTAANGQSVTVPLTGTRQ
jgi:hypothetical protein